METKTWILIGVAAVGIWWLMNQSGPKASDADYGVLNRNGPPVNNDSKLADAVNTGIAAYNAATDLYARSKSY